MRHSKAIAGSAGQQLTALLLFALYLLLPAAPLLGAAAARPEACKCCRHMRTKCCCQHSHEETAPGPSWGSAPKCGAECGQSGGLTTSAPFFAPTTLRAATITPRAIAFGRARRSHRGDTSYFSWRYQRPPPLA